MSDNSAVAPPNLPSKVAPADVKQHPAYYLDGPGQAAAYGSDCAHGHRLTDSCPNCP